ncbi:Fe-S cluster assembly protein SufD [Aliihoeflea sp. PC F10.4]
MNVHATPKLTSAEEALIEGFQTRKGALVGSPDVAAKRNEAADILKAGLPTRRVEAWHYTDLRRLLATVPADGGKGDAAPVEPLVEGSTVLAVLDGKADAGQVPQGVRLEKVADRLMSGALAADLAPVHADDTVGAINAAFVTDGYVLEIEEGAEIAAPIELQNIHSGGQVHSRFTVNVGKGAKVTIVERQTGSADALVSSIADLDVADGATVNWLIVQDQPKDATHLGQIRGRFGAESNVTLFIMNTGAKLVRQEVHVVAAGEESEFRLRGVNLLGGETHCDVTMVLDHAAPHTTSTEIIRNVITDKAHGVFQGQIRVDRLAQKTDAKMACNTLLLSDDGEFSTKPELEIFADDVACGHGATVTEIDGDHLFYLMARGVEEKLARGLLVKAFLREIVEELDDEAIVEALETRLENWFVTHG